MSTLQTMWNPTKLNDGRNAPYGLGWFVRTDNGRRCVRHTGAHATGFTTVASRHLDDKLTVIVLEEEQALSLPCSAL